MDQINILIVEDNLLVAESLSVLLKKHGLHVAATCDSGEDAIRLSGEVDTDLILMDIELSGAMDGISAAQVIQEKHSIPVIYLSDYKDEKTVGRAKKTFPANYLTKPFQELDLIRAIDIAFTNANAVNRTKKLSVLNRSIFVKSDTQKYIKLNYSDIAYLEAGRAYCLIVTDDEKKHTISISLNHVLEQLDPEEFMRVHRSHAVNVNKINAVNGNMLSIGKHEIQMSKEYRDILMGRLKIIK